MTQLSEISLQMAKLSKLARLELQPGDEELLSSRIEKILEAFKSIQALDLKGVEPMYGLNEEMQTRDDETSEPINRDLLMANAADSFDGAYRVGRIVRSES